MNFRFACTANFKKYTPFCDTIADALYTCTLFKYWTLTYMVIY
jgi:hypothetical protein